MKKRLAIFIFLIPVFAACKLPEHLNDESWHPVPMEVENPDVFSCSIENGSLVINKKSQNLDELEIIKPGRDESLVVIIESPVVELKINVTPAEFLRQEKTVLSLEDLQGYSPLSHSPKSELIFDQSGEYEILATSALESDEPRFVCRVNFGGWN